MQVLMYIMCFLQREDLAARVRSGSSQPKQLRMNAFQVCSIRADDPIQVAVKSALMCSRLKIGHSAQICHPGGCVSKAADSLAQLV